MIINLMKIETGALISFMLSLMLPHMIIKVIIVSVKSWKDLNEISEIKVLKDFTDISKCLHE